MIATTLAAPSLPTLMPDMPPPDGATPLMPGGFASLLVQLKLVPDKAPAADIPVVTAPTADTPETRKAEPDSGAVPDGLEDIADALAKALAAVLTAAGKPAQAKLGHRLATMPPGLQKRLTPDTPAMIAPLDATPDASLPAVEADSETTETTDATADPATADQPTVPLRQPILAADQPADPAVSIATPLPVMPVISDVPAAQQPSTAPIAITIPIRIPGVQMASANKAAPGVSLPVPTDPAEAESGQPAPALPRAMRNHIPLGALAAGAPPAIAALSARLLPLVARLETADAPSAPVDPATPDQPAQAAEPLAGLPTPAPLATPLPVSSPTFTLDATALQPASTAQIVIGHHLDLAKDGEWLDRLARDITRMANHDAQLRFQLNPEHLGSLHVELANTADGTAIRLTADTEAARNILVDAQPRLVAEARAQGLRISGAEVDLGGQGSQQRGRETTPQIFVRTQASAEAPATPSRRSAAERYA